MSKIEAVRYLAYDSAMNSYETEQPKEQGDGKEISRKQFLDLIGAALAGGFVERNNPFSHINTWKLELPEQKAGTIRMLLIGDVHAAFRDTSKRQSNSDSLIKLVSVVRSLQGSQFDQYVQMGDLVNRGAGAIDLYKACIKIFQTLPFPGVHLLGNHDTWAIPEDQLSAVREDFQLGLYYGRREFGNFQIVWLDMSAQEQMPASLPEERIDWLREVIHKDTPTFIFTHYGFVPQNPEGSPYFDGDPGLTALSNGQTVLRALEGLPVQAVFSAHMHWGGFRQESNIPMLTIPAFVENIASSRKENPGIYSILDISSPTSFTLKSFFGSTCFMNVQIS